ncbi:50S ribosomal protein L11 [Candidatus Kaiserbacteria bacterium RIFCSPHIGHO2_02_FULL_49_11]|uniref:Large ribosomal subunit protein uL11 n=1 Tax=Candidatus Kaiserbacteria bacterium RIFCSPHIGHO2_02_FULL_49_11 TaxID=1798489 RepID=A0A1F6D1W2_9BACT|nr:MAG: 50S ribosomal protein L11 [Candidatus Kaiserbacteria bacterium RIFCSPHIGHO2_02_FULL_49_11]
MAKKVTRKIKLLIAAGKATPAPPVGTALGPVGINIGDFVNRFNEATREKMGNMIPVELSVYEDRSFDFILKTPPASQLLLKKLGKEKGSGKNLVSKVGVVTRPQLEEIATEKMQDLNTKDMNQAVKIIAGTARSMGIDVKE